MRALCSGAYLSLPHVNPRENLADLTVCAIQILTVTEGPSLYQVTYVTETRTLGHAAKVSVAESCALTRGTEANCMVTLSVSLDGKSVVTSTPVAISGTDFNVYQVAITGGADKTTGPVPTDACKASSAAAAGAGPSVVMAGVVAVVGLLGVVAL